MAEKANKNWIQKATQNKGALHRSLGVPTSKKIPESKIKTGERSKSPTIRKQSNLADTLAGLRKK